MRQKINNFLIRKIYNKGPKAQTEVSLARAGNRERESLMLLNTHLQRCCPSSAEARGGPVADIGN